METKKELQKEIENLMEQPLIPKFVLEALKNIKDIVARMPDDESVNDVILSQFDLNIISEAFSLSRIHGQQDKSSIIDKLKILINKNPKTETKPEPSLLEVAMLFYCHYEDDSIKDCFDIAELLIAENERRKNDK